MAYLPAWMTYKRNLQSLPTYDVAARHYQYWHIPRPPVEDPAGSTPGLICWGAAGAMPTAEPLPTVDFNVKRTETHRVSEDVRIENPDDSSQYVIAKRAAEISFLRMNNNPVPAPNTSTVPAPGTSDYGAGASKFITVGGGAQSGGSETFVYAKPTAP